MEKYKALHFSARGFKTAKNDLDMRVHIENRSKFELLTFGSEISLQLMEKPDWFLYSDGFIENELYCMDFSMGLHKINTFDFDKSIFKILPFSSIANFKTQKELHEKYYERKSLKKEIKRLSFLGVKDRRNEIKEKEQNFREELKMTENIYKKMKGTNIVFGASSFLLIHKLSLKYLSLRTEDKDNMSFCLVDYPNENSFFKFMSSLKIQNQRDNLVYSNDQIYLCNDMLMINQAPYVYLDIPNGLNDKTYKAMVHASLEDKVKLRVNLTQKIDVSEGEDYLKVGEVIWLHFSEKEYCLEASISEANKKSAIDRIYSSKMNDGQDVEKFSSNIIKSLQTNIDIKFIDLLSRRNSQNSLTSGLKPEGMFKIEEQNPLYSERVVWHMCRYRLKHIATNKYLYIDTDGKLGLESAFTKRTLFSFHPIKSLKEKRRSSHVGKDSYFKLRSYDNLWFRLPPECHTSSGDKEHSNDVIKYKPDITTEIDTLKVSKSKFEEVWQTNFLLSRLPTLIEGVVAFRLIDISKDYRMINPFKKIHKKLAYSLQSLQDFISNSLLSNIAMENEFGVVSKMRQQHLVDINICEFIISLIDVIFEDLEKLDKDIRDFLVDSHDILWKNSKKTNRVDAFTKEREKKLLIFHYLERMEILTKCYNLLENVSLANPEIQLLLTKNIDKLVKYLGFTPAASSCIKTIVSNNNEILMNFSKLEVDESGQKGIVKGTYFFDSIIKLLLKYQKYTRNDILNFISSLCFISTKSYYLNQNNINNVIRIKDIFDNHIIKTRMISKGDSFDLEVKYFNSYGMIEVYPLQEIVSMNFIKIKKFLISQLDLYTSLAINRNTINGLYYGSRYPLKFLSSAIYNEKYGEDLRASFLRMLIALYIDKPPRSEIKFPLLIRDLSNTSTKVRSQEKHRREELYITDEHTQLVDKQLSVFGDSRSAEEHKVLIEIREQLIKMLERKANKLHSLKRISDVYNEFTLEIVNALFTLLKFGVYGFNNENDISSIQRMVKILSSLLEYSKEYYEAMKNEKLSFGDSKRPQDYQNQARKRLNPKLIQSSNQDSFSSDSSRLNNNRIFKKSVALKKILSKFLNKTYQATLDTKEYDLKIEIKSVICKILSSILKMRDEHILSNAFRYFNDKFVPRSMNIFKSKNARTEDSQATMMRELVLLIKGAIPNLNFKAGVIGEASHFKSILKHMILPNLDQIIGRSFFEPLITSIYFSHTSELRNTQIMLLKSFSLQRRRLKSSLEKTFIIFNEQERNAYYKLKDNFEALDHHKTVSQVWLLIIKKEFYQIEYDDNLTIVNEKLTDLEKFLKSDVENGDLSGLKTKQSILRKLKTHELLLLFLREGVMIYDVLVEISNNPDLHFQSYRSDIFEKICKLFKLCHRNLELFCQGNSINQEIILGNIKLFVKNKFIDVGQVELIQAVFFKNQEIYSNFTQDLLRYLLDLTKIHGRRLKFIQLLVNITSDPITSLELKEQIISHILMEDYIGSLSAFTEKGIPISAEATALHKKVEQYSFRREFNFEEYEDGLSQILSNCISSKLGTNLMSKVFDLYPIERIENNIQSILQGFTSKQDCSGLGLDHKMKKLLCLHNLMNKFARRMEHHFNKDISVNKKFYESYLKSTIVLIDSNLNEENASVLKSYLLGSCLELVDLILLGFSKIGSSKNTLSDYCNSLLDKVSSKRALLFENKKMKVHEAGNLWRVCMKLRFTINGILEEREINTIDNFKKRLVFINSELIEDNFDSSTINKSQSIRNNYEIRSKEEAWEFFKSEILQSDEFNEALKEEEFVLSETIINFDLAYNKQEDSDLKINCKDIISTLLTYLKQSIQNVSYKENAIFVLQTLGRILGWSEDLETMISIQNMLNELGTTAILINMFSSEEENDMAYLSQVVKVIILLLEEGNKNVQDTIFMTFKSGEFSEKFFRKIENLLVSQIEILKNQEIRGEKRRKNKQFIMEIFEMLRLFCEGHNQDLQDYIRFQSFSQNSFDVIKLIVTVLSSVKIVEDTVDLVEKIFDTLTEFCQGPCKGNQEQIINSKFLEYATGLLKGEERIFAISNPELEENNNFLSNIVLQEVRKSKKVSDVPSYKIERIRFKCIITIMSLIEQRDKNDRIFDRIVVAMPIKILKKRLTKIYKAYVKAHDNKYTNEVFGWNEIPYNIKLHSPAKYECIIENGFNIFILIRTILEKAGSKDDELRKLESELNNLNLQESLILGIGRVFTQFYLSLKWVVKMVFCCGCCSRKKKTLKEKLILTEAQHSEAALIFFKSNTAQIDIVREEVLERLYFPLMPSCKSLSDKEKKKFQETVDRSSIKTKLNHLMKASDRIISIMEHEYNLRIFFERYKVFGYIDRWQKVWEASVFMLACILNLMIIFEYRIELDEVGFGLPALKDISFFVVALMVLFLGIIIWVLVFLKRAPVLYKPVKDEYINWKVHNPQLSFYRYSIAYIRTSLTGLGACLSDGEVMYHTLYVAFAAVGLLWSYICFMFHLSDFLRLDLLKNIVSAVWIRRTPLLLTFLLFLLIEYYFTILGYIWFYEQYPNKRCYRLWECFFETFDLTFKEGGGVGAFLTDLWDLEENQLYLRFFFDNIFNLLQIQIMLNMVAGIIIDEFGALKESLNERNKDMIQCCFICGIDTDRLEKNSTGFFEHYKHQHNMWNYIFYINYLKRKPKTEYTGTESYIESKISGLDLDWFPIKRYLISDH